MSETEDKLAREFGFRVEIEDVGTEREHIYYAPLESSQRIPGLPIVLKALWRKCLELLEENTELQEELDGWKGL